MMAADLVDRIGGAIRVELNCIVVGASWKIAKEQDEGSVINVAGTDACFCKVTNSDEDIGVRVVGKVNECAYSEAKW